MADKNPIFIINGATALYPRINQTYKWTKRDGKRTRIACDPFDDGAEYSMNLILTKEQAVPLYKAMKEAYEAGKEKGYPDFPKSGEVFEAGQNEGEFVISSKLKGSFDRKESTWVDQFDASNNELPRDFLLTGGSKINVLVALIVYDPTHMDGCGVSLRLRQVQVIDLAVLKKRSAFSAMEGGFNSKSEGFATSLDTVADTAGEDDDFDEPKPKAKPVEDFDEPEVKVKEEPKKETKDVGDFDDIDKALENLDFDD